MTIPMKLVEAVASSIARLQVPGLSGWGLRVCDEMEDVGELLDVGPSLGCVNETCAHMSHSPAAPDRRWVPSAGKLVHLGGEDEDPEMFVDYYALISDNEVRYVQLIEKRHYHARAAFVPSVPDWALAELAGVGDRA